MFMALRQARARPGLSALENLDDAIALAAAGGIARAEKVAEATVEFQALVAKESPAIQSRIAARVKAMDAAALRQAADLAAAQRQQAAEIEECKAEIMGSLRLPADERRRLLRGLQVKWHPDNFPGDDPTAVEAREFAGVVVRIANEAAAQAKKVRNKQIRDKKRSAAYEVLQAAMPTLFGRNNDAATLRSAIEDAREAGVSLVALRDAENALAKMEGTDKAA